MRVIGGGKLWLNENCIAIGVSALPLVRILSDARGGLVSLEAELLDTLDRQGVGGFSTFSSTDGLFSSETGKDMSCCDGQAKISSLELDCELVSSPA